ncbi:MAG: hypothetical protein ACKV0T_07175 [Planctomycetales bacterium]
MRIFPSHDWNARWRAVAPGLLLGLFLAVGLVSAPGADAPPPVETPEPQKLESATIENLFRLSPNILSGAQPEGEAGFAELKRLGVRTIISVDGAAPDVLTARQHGLRYVHLPIGYDGIAADRGLRLIKAARELPGPIFVHCHHGKHRGPAAAALCAVAVESWPRDLASQWMRDAGTGPQYRGLFRSVATLPLPTADQLRKSPSEFPEQMEVSTLIEVMVQVDHEWDRLKLHQKRGFAPVSDNEDVVADEDEVTPAQSALQLAEQFRELARAPFSAQRGEEFLAAVRSAQKETDQFERALRHWTEDADQPARQALDQAFQRVAKSCTTCHAAFRDNPP